MALAATFLGGAKSRLLPPSVPFRYFVAASLFHVLAWVHLAIGADAAVSFTGGTGMVLASIHVLTLGVFVMTAMGAAFQLLPVATQKPLIRVWPARLCFWLLVPGTLLLVHGMETGTTMFMHIGAALATVSLIIFAVVIAFNLRRSAGMPVVTSHGWASLAALITFIALALALIVDFDTGFLDNHSAAAVAHMLLAGFGFMGMLAFGFSHILVPMFALSRTLSPRLSWAQFWLATAASIAAGIGAVINANLVSSLVLSIAALLGLGATAAYLALMRQALKTGMRKRLGLSFILIKASWVALALCLVIGLAVSLGLYIPNGATLFGFLLLAGWLLTFLTGILQRILPFLASMHAAGKGGKPPLLSELTAETPLKVHAVCHGMAVVLCTVAIVSDNVIIMQAGTALGTAGALAFALFVVLTVSKLRQPAAT